MLMCKLMDMFARLQATHCIGYVRRTSDKVDWTMDMDVDMDWST